MEWRQHTEEDIRLGAQKVKEAMAGESTFFIGRNGTVETEALYYYITQRANHSDPLDWPPRLLDQLQRHAGIFPSTPEAVDRWCKQYLSCLKDLTGTAAGWYQPFWNLENTILDRFTEPTCFRTPLRSLEPYYHAPDLWWTKTLAGKKVAVVTSFANTVDKQVRSGRLAAAWPAGLMDMSGVQWTFIRTGYAPTLALGRAGWPPGITNWVKAVESVVVQVLRSKAQVAIIGCGGLGMIVGGLLKRWGVSSIVLGGATQVLFGIKGRRWANHSVISKFWGEGWVWPAADEIPGGADLIEGGCYWGGPV